MHLIIIKNVSFINILVILINLIVIKEVRNLIFIFFFNFGLIGHDGLIKLDGLFFCLFAFVFIIYMIFLLNND